MIKKVLFICKNRIDSYGRSVGLIVSAEMISNYLHFIDLDSKVVQVVDGNSIDREVFNYKPDLVVIEAIWVTVDKMRELLSIPRYKNLKWVVRIHSKIPFLATEGIAISWLAGYRELAEEFSNFNISANNRSVCDDFWKVLEIEETYLPNIYYPSDFTIPKRVRDKKYMHVGCFGALRPLKNQLIQAIAAIEYGDERGLRIKFHINSDRQEQNGENVYKNLKALFDASEEHSLVGHPWLDHEDFIKLVRKMNIGLQVSMTESFNLVAADFVWNNIPVIGSKDIDWLPSIFRADPNSTKDIKKKMDFILNNQDPKLYKLSNLALDCYNHKAKNCWDLFLKLSI